MLRTGAGGAVLCEGLPARVGLPRLNVSDFLEIAAFFAGWLLLQRLILPRLGVPS